MNSTRTGQTDRAEFEGAPVPFVHWLLREARHRVVEGEPRESMWLIRHIIVPDDFSDASEWALDRAIDIASQLGATITVVHATPQIPDEQVRMALESRVLPRKNRGIDLRTELRRGPAVEAVLEAARELGASLIIVGTHGRRGVARRVLGSIAEEIVGLAKIPVLVVHPYEGIERPPAPPFGVGHEAGVRQP